MRRAKFRELNFADKDVWDPPKDTPNIASYVSYSYNIGLLDAKTEDGLDFK